MRVGLKDVLHNPAYNLFAFEAMKQTDLGLNLMTKRRTREFLAQTECVDLGRRWSNLSRSTRRRLKTTKGPDIRMNPALAQFSRSHASQKASVSEKAGVSAMRWEMTLQVSNKGCT